jgi:hypothetical protein
METAAHHASRKGITLTELRSWKWERLRSNPRFQKIIALGAADAQLR